MELKFNINGINLFFNINDKKQIRLYYLGLDSFLSKLPEDVLSEFRFVEVQVAGLAQNEHHGIKNTSTYFGKNALYENHEYKELKDKKILKIVTKDDYLKVNTYFTFFNGTKTFNVYNEVENIYKEELTLEYVSSFYYYGLANGIKNNKSKNLNFHYAHNSWHTETQWKNESFYDLGLYNGNKNLSMKRINLNNTGSWSTKEYLPISIVENKLTKEFILTQIENNGSWHIECGEARDEYYLAASGPTFIDNHWAKTLEPGEFFEGVKCSVVVERGFEEVFRELTKYRRIVRRKFRDCVEIPTIYNAYMHGLWDNPSEEELIPMIDICSELGVDYFCIDAGWFKDDYNNWDRLGDWEVSKVRFPNGLKAVMDYIRKKGMKPGLWFEVEAAGSLSKLFNEKPKEWFFTRNGKETLHHNRKQLDFRNKEVVDFVDKIIVNAIENYGLDYIKMDYNTCSGPGTELKSDSLGDGLLEHARAYLKWINSVYDRYPNLVIENCGSGGCRMDQLMLNSHSIQSTSDQTDYRLYPYLSGNVLTAATPEQAGVWSYPKDDRIEIKDINEEIVAMNMCNAMLGRIHLASKIYLLDNHLLKLIKEGINYYNNIKNIKISSYPIYPKGIANFGDREVVSGLLNEKRIILGIWNTANDKNEIVINLSKYKVKNLKLAYPLTLETNYIFNETTQILKIKFNKFQPYAGRIFEGEL